MTAYWASHGRDCVRPCAVVCPRAGPGRAGLVPGRAQGLRGLRARAAGRERASFPRKRERFRQLQDCGAGRYSAIRWRNVSNLIFCNLKYLPALCSAVSLTFHLSKVSSFPIFPHPTRSSFLASLAPSVPIPCPFLAPSLPLPRSKSYIYPSFAPRIPL